MSYKYKPDNYKPKVGDVVVWTELPLDNRNRTRNKPYTVLKVYDLICPVIVDDNKDTRWYGTSHGFKVIETKLGTEAKIGDTVICTEWKGDIHKAGDVEEVDAEILKYIQDRCGKWLVLCQEDSTTRPAGPEFTYPLYKKWKSDGSVFKFTSIGEAVCIVPDSIHRVGLTPIAGFAKVTDSRWEDFDPTSSEGYDHQYNYFKSKLDEIDLSFLVHNDVVVRTFGSIPLAQAIVDRAHECGGYKHGNVSCYQNITDEDKCIGSDPSESCHGAKFWYDINDSYTILTWEELLAYEDNIEEPEEVDDPATTVGIPPLTTPGVYNVAAGSVLHSTLCPEIQLIKEEPMAKVGGKVIAVDNGSSFNKGDIRTVTKVDGNNIWVSDTNAFSWTLGMTWKLYQEETLDSAPVATTETSETTTQKENNMNTTGINYTDARPAPKTLQDLLNEMFGAQLVTDLKNKPATLAMVFDANEDLVEIIALPNDKAAIKLLQNNARKYLDYTISTYSYNDTHAIQFPVSSEKAELKAAKKRNK